MLLSGGWEAVDVPIELGCDLGVAGTRHRRGGLCRQGFLDQRGGDGPVQCLPRAAAMSGNRRQGC